MDVTRVWRLEGVVQPDAWGSPTATRLCTAEHHRLTQAELWLGGHASAPSTLVSEVGHPIAFDAWIRSDPERVFGVRTARRFDAELPFLMKVLAAARARAGSQ